MSIIHGENRFFGPPKVQEAYNVTNFLFLMESSILKKLVPWMLKSPLTSVLKSKIKRFLSANETNKALAHGLELCPYYVKVVNLIDFVRNIFPKFYKFKIDSAPYTVHIPIFCNS